MERWCDNGFDTVNDNNLTPNMSVFVLSLSHLAKNKIAQVFWTSPRMKNFMKTIFIDNTPEKKYPTICRKADDTAQKVRKFKHKLFREYVRRPFPTDKYFGIKKQFYTEAYQQLENMLLSVPSPVKRQLRIAIRVWGETLFTSLKDISRTITATGGNLPQSMGNFIDNICLTNFGTVDLSATFHKIYSAEPSEVDYYMWILACEMCLEEYILLWSPRLKKGTRKGKMVEMVKLIFEDTHLKGHSDVASHGDFWKSRDVFRYSYYSHFLMYWKLRKSQEQTTADWSLFMEYIDNILDNFVDEWDVYNTQDSIEENMFRVSVVIGNFHAVKYFWNKLSTEAKSTVGVEKMIAIACWYEWKIRYPSLCICQDCDQFLPKRTQFFNIICFLIQYMSQYESDELFRPELELHRLYRRQLKEFLPLVFLVNYEKHPEFCSNSARKAFHYVGNEPFLYEYTGIMDNLLKVLQHESGLHDEDIFDILREYLRLSPVDSESEMRNYLLWKWHVYSDKRNLIPVLDLVINHPDLPEFALDNDIRRKYMKMVVEAHSDRLRDEI